MSERFFVWLITNPVTTWLLRHVVSRIDPWLYRRSNGTRTVFGRPSGPMVTLMTRGARTGEARPVHLAAIEHAGHLHVVASAMGQRRHPGWRYNLEAHPVVEVQGPGERYTARAELLTDDEKAALWADVHAAIPMMAVYERRTDRNIRVFRLRREGGVAAADQRAE